MGIDPALLSATAGFLGSIVGASAALGSQYVAQQSISNREVKERERKEERVRSLFGWILRELYARIRVINHDPGFQELAKLTNGLFDNFNLLKALYADTSLMLCLTPEEHYCVVSSITSITEALNESNKVLVDLADPKGATAPEKSVRSIYMTASIDLAEAVRGFKTVFPEHVYEFMFPMHG